MKSALCNWKHVANWTHSSVAVAVACGLLLAGCLDTGKKNTKETYTVSGTLSGLASGKTVVLQNNTSDSLTLSANGTYTFSAAYDDSSAYSVTVKTQPSGQTCRVANGTGTLSKTNINNITVTCYNSGTLDTSFNTNGIVVHNNAAGGYSADFGMSITTDANGKILVAGTSYNSSISSMTPSTSIVIWRYNSDGTLDTTFDSDGIVVLGTSGFSHGHSITTDANGKILIVATGAGSLGDGIIICRFNNDGTLDTSLDTDGIVAVSKATGIKSVDNGKTITVDANGKILIVASNQNSAGNTDMAILRYNQDGTPDSSFGINGEATHNNAAGGNGNDRGQSIMLDANGKILVTGNSKNAAQNLDMVIWRYNSDGTLDTSFGVNGIVVDGNAVGNGDDLGYAITTSANRIFVTGSSWNGSDDDMVIWQYDSDGHALLPPSSVCVDSTCASYYWISKPLVTHNGAAGGTSGDYGQSIAVDANGKIVVTGYSGRSDSINLDNDMVIWRYNSNGTLDTTFDTDGIVISNSVNRNDYGQALTLDVKGNLLVAGYNDVTVNAPGGIGVEPDMVIWRFIP